jgi:hypothetical protein
MTTHSAPHAAHVGFNCWTGAATRQAVIRW